MNSSRTEVSAELEIGLVSPENVIVPLMAGLAYTSEDPYAVRMAFDVGTDKPVEWILARDLLAAALQGPEGIGDVRAWPSAASCDQDTRIVPAEAGTAEASTAEAGTVGARHGILNIEMSSPFGQAQFEISAPAIGTFLDRTYLVVPAGQEPGYLDFEAELTELLSQA
jgi:hypothetical protein